MWGDGGGECAGVCEVDVFGVAFDVFWIGPGCLGDWVSE